MEMAMIGDKYLTRAFRLIGIETIEATSDDMARKKVEELVSKGECRIIFITENVTLELKALRENLIRAKRYYPLFVVIPDLEGPTTERVKEMYQLVNNAIGVKRSD